MAANDIAFYKSFLKILMKKLANAGDFLIFMILLPFKVLGQLIRHMYLDYQKRHHAVRYRHYKLSGQKVALRTGLECSQINSSIRQSSYFTRKIEIGGPLASCTVPFLILISQVHFSNKLLEHFHLPRKS